METGLLPANSDSIDLIESQLLETVSNVNDDEDVVMVDDLLDLELDAIILSQSTCSNMVSRVPYKNICDSQTSNSRSSPELCCKGQLRSNNNSTLLDDTHSSTSPWIPSLQMALELSPHHLLNPVMSCHTRWSQRRHRKPRRKSSIIVAMKTVPCVDSANNTSQPLAGCGYTCHNISLPPSVPVGSLATTGTMYSAIRER